MSKLAVRILFASVFALILIVLGFLIFDRPISMAAHTLAYTTWHKLGTWISMAANHHCFNALVLAGLLWGALDVYRNGWTDRSRAILCVCLSVAVAMLAGDVLKHFFGRHRPPMLFEKGLYGFAYFEGGDMQHSFPSGHTLRIFSATVALALLFPRLRILLIILACLVGISRVVVTRHYPSDVIFGAWVGIMSAWLTWRVMMSHHFAGGTPRYAAKQRAASSEEDEPAEKA